MFMMTVLVFCIMYPEWGGTPIETSWERRIKSLPNLIPPMLVFVVVVGTIYAGWATPTEAASLGVVFALILAGYYKSLSLDMLREAVEGTMKTTAMVMLIILAAIFLNFILAFIGLTEQLTRFIQGLGLGPTNTLLVIIVFYLVLGCFMETLSMLITTAPLITPIVVALGYRPGVVRHPAHRAARDRLDHAARRRKSVRGARRSSERRVERRDHRHPALRGDDVPDAGVARRVPAGRALAAEGDALGHGAPPVAQKKFSKKRNVAFRRTEQRFANRRCSLIGQTPAKTPPKADANSGREEKYRCPENS